MTGTIAELVNAADFYNALHLGYDQSNRWYLVLNGECDCSSLCGSIIKKAGYPIDLKTMPFYTGNFAQRAKAAGFAILKFTSLSQIKTGDFLVTPGHHVEFVYNARTFFSARFDENGHASGGKTGNQNNRETGFVPANVRPGGWTYICRPPADIVVVPPVVVPPVVKTTVTAQFTIAHCSLDAKQFGGPDDYAGIAEKLFATGADIITLTESVSGGRSVFDSVLEKLSKDKWEREIHPGGKIAVLYNADKFTPRAIRQLTFKNGDPWHGILFLPVVEKTTGKGVDIGVIHVRPTVVATPAQKVSDIKKGLTKVGTWDTIIQGDFNSDPDVLMASKGYIQISKRGVTVGKSSEYDNAYMNKTAKIKVISASIFDPGKYSDHMFIVETVEVEGVK